MQEIDNNSHIHTNRYKDHKNGHKDFTKIELNEKSKKLLEKIKVINNNYFFEPKEFTNDFKKIEASVLNNVLHNFFIDQIENEQIKDPIQFLKRLASILPLDELQEATKNNIEGFTTALDEAKDRLNEAKVYLEAIKSPSPTLRSRISSLLDGMICIIECIIATFGVGDFFRPAEGSLEAEMKSHKLIMLIQLFGTISVALLPLISATTGVMIISGTIFFILALSIIWPYIKPITNHLPSGENWSKKYKQGVVAEGRKETLDEIARLIIANEHPILTGSSTVGKTATAAAFTQAVKRGDYPELEDKVIFCFNMQDLFNQRKPHKREAGGNVINKINETIGRHQNNFILIFDQLRMDSDKDGEFADQLNIFLERGGRFPHLIGIMTDENYKKGVENKSSFFNRFNQVEVKNTSEEETITILCNMALRSPVKPLLEKDAPKLMKLIFEESTKAIENAPQPTTAIRLLERCINRTTKTQKSPTEKKITLLSDKLKSLQLQAALSRGDKEMINIDNLDKPKTIRGLSKDLEKELETLKKEYSEEKKEIGKLFKSKELFDLVTKEIYSSIERINKISREILTPSDQQELKMFLLLEGFLATYLKGYLIKQSKALNETKTSDMKDDKIEENTEEKNGMKKSTPPKINLFINEAMIKEEAVLLRL